MVPRIRTSSCLNVQGAFLREATQRRPQICIDRLAVSFTHLRPFSSSQPTAARKEKKERPQFRDMFAIRQADKRKQAHKARDGPNRLRQREAAGDPIKGAAETTPFVQSFDTALDLDAAPGQPPKSEETLSADDGGAADQDTTPGSAKSLVGPRVAQTGHLNHFFTEEALKSSLALSKQLSAPYIAPNRAEADPAREEDEKAQHELLHAVRRDAVSRILAVENASSDQRTSINTQRCIEKFGRHNTDRVFQPKVLPGGEEQPLRARAGLDTGSSEVQIAILTAKIRVLMGEFEGRSKNDKINKRNLRVLLHKRQKLLKYFLREDRGGERWQHLLDTLGLTPATWTGEITVR